MVIRPTNSGKKLNEENSSKEEINWNRAANDMAGRPKRKENFAASPLSHPVTKQVEIVTPDLEMPGKIAKAWVRPIKKLFERLWFFKFIEPFLELSARYM